MRAWHELRVREHIGPDKWVKKSKFYFVHRPKDATRIYEKNCKVDHTIMWCVKRTRQGPDQLAAQAARLSKDIKREQMSATRDSTGLGVIGSFLKLGDELLGELRSPKESRNRRNNGYTKENPTD